MRCDRHESWHHGAGCLTCERRMDATATRTEPVEGDIVLSSAPCLAIAPLGAWGAGGCCGENPTAGCFSASGAIQARFTWVLSDSCISHQRYCHRRDGAATALNHQTFLFLFRFATDRDGRSCGRHVHAAPGCGSIHEPAESRRLPGDLSDPDGHVQNGDGACPAGCL
jgi:hypothetical protein